MPSRFLPPTAPPAVVSRHRVAGLGARGNRPPAARMADFLRAIDEDAEPALSEIAGDVAIELSFGLPEGHSLIRRRSLDNYLVPVVSRLGQRRIPAVFARKRHADTSTLRLGPACLRPDDEPPAMSVRTTEAPETAAWQEEIHDACEAAVDQGPRLSGRLRLDLAFGVSSLLNWTTLWKPAIDALGPLLGVADPERPWAPRDDRVVSLGLHRVTDDSLGHDVVVRAWWSREVRPRHPSSESL